MIELSVQMVVAFKACAINGNLQSVICLLIETF